MSGVEKKNVTITDVARLAGVSTSSVSNVLNGRTHRMRSATQERIDAAIRKLGYRPNPAARQLKTGQSSYLGLVVPSVANPFYGTFVHLIEEEALKRGFHIMLGNSGRDPASERNYAEQLWNGGVTGIIFGTSLPDYTHLQKLVGQGMHLVAVDQPPLEDDGVTIDSIGMDNIKAMRLLVQHLYALDHRRIGFISGPIKTLTREFRLKGYQAALSELGLSFDPRLVWEGTPNSFGDVAPVEVGRQGAHHLLSESNPPTAIIAINDMNAFGIYAGARDLGVRIPDQLSVVGVDNLTLAEIVEPPLTTIAQPLEDMAHRAVERLIGRMNGTYVDPSLHQMVSPALVVRNSTKRLP